MSIIEWDKRFELGVKPFDDQHKRLVELLNYLHDNINASGVTHEDLGAVIVKLADYTTYHFAAEEKTMAHYEYPGLASHREEHAKFCRMVAAFQNDFENNQKDFSLNVLSFIGNWLFDHILLTDTEYCKFIEHLATAPPKRTRSGALD